LKPNWGAGKCLHQMKVKKSYFSVDKGDERVNIGA
jgi:hypothetical protein